MCFTQIEFKVKVVWSCVLYTFTLRWLVCPKKGQTSPFMGGCFKGNKSVCEKLTQRGCLADDKHLKEVNWRLYWVGFLVKPPREQGLQGSCRRSRRQSSLGSPCEGATTVWKGPLDSGKESGMGISPPTKELDLEQMDWKVTGTLKVCPSTWEFENPFLGPWTLKKIPTSQCWWTSLAFMKFIWSNEIN